VNQTLVYGDGALETIAKFQISFFLSSFANPKPPANTPTLSPSSSASLSPNQIDVSIHNPFQITLLSYDVPPKPLLKLDLSHSLLIRVKTF
jgi:hypothetical protein